MQRQIKSLMDRPRTVVAGVTLLCVIAVAMVALARQGEGPWLEVDASFEALLPADAEITRRQQVVDEVFGSTDPVVIAIEVDELFSRQGLATVTAVHEHIEATPWVKAVESLASMPNLLFDAGDALDVGSVTQQLARNPERVLDIAFSARRNPMLQSLFFNEDTQTTAFILEAEDSLSDAELQDKVRALREEIAAMSGVRHAASAGNGLVRAATTDAVWTGLLRILPLAAVLVIVLLALAFRSALVVALGAMSIGVSLLIMWAWAATLGYSLNMVSAIAPPVVVAFGIMFSIHMVSEWLRHAVGQDAQRARKAVGEIALPLLLNGVTTSLGIAALLLSPLPAVREFAVLCIIGVVSLTVLSLSYLPALLLLLGSRISQQPPPGELYAQSVARGLAWLDIRWRKQIVAGAALAVLLGLWVSQRLLEPGTAYVENFPESAEVRQQYERINTRLGGAASITIVLETPLDHALLDPVVANAIDDFMAWLRKQPEVGAALSYVDYLKVLYASMESPPTETLRYPESQRLARQLIMFAGSDAISGLLDGAQRHSLIPVRINVDHSSRISDLVTRIEAELHGLPNAVRADVVGTPVLAARTVESIVDRQWLSVAAALLAILAVLYFLFLSLRAALIAMLPNLVPVSIYFGLLAVTGIGLNPATSLIACLVIGVAVDDTIHFLARFNSEARARGNEGQAVAVALGSILRPVTLTTATLVLSFGAFVTSPLLSQAQFGILAAFALFLAWVTDVFVTPALGSMVRIVTLWDLVRVDLGSAPQYSVPLLAGMTNRQARLFALTAHYETVPAGTDIMREGEVSDEILVCIDGQLEVWVERDGQKRVLNCLFRGATLGEAGYFGQRRTASVTTKSRARLLRFNYQDLERLRRRHPRIAALVLRNLNRIQAERLAHATAMLR